jgi:Family of unknown function (DUF5681)
MSDTAIIAEETAPKQRVIGVPFKPGQSGNPAGRPKGARSKLGEAFLEDLRDAWLEHGAEALRRCATEDPAQFVRVVASLMPKDVNLNVAVDATEFVGKFRQAVALLGNTAPPKVINGR